MMTLLTIVIVCLWAVQVCCQINSGQFNDHDGVDRYSGPNALAGVAEISERYVKIHLLPRFNGQAVAVEKSHRGPQRFIANGDQRLENGQPFPHYFRFPNKNWSQDLRKHWNLPVVDGIVYPIYVLKRLNKDSVSESAKFSSSNPSLAKNITENDSSSGKGLGGALKEFAQKVKHLFEPKNQTQGATHDALEPSQKSWPSFRRMKSSARLQKRHGDWMNAVKRPTKHPLVRSLKTEPSIALNTPIHFAKRLTKKFAVGAVDNGNYRQCETHKVLNYIVYKYCPEAKMNPRRHSNSHPSPRYSKSMNKKKVKTYLNTRSLNLESG